MLTSRLIVREDSVSWSARNQNYLAVKKKFQNYWPMNGKNFKIKNQHQQHKNLQLKEKKKL